MHLSDVIELAKEIRARCNAGSVTVSVGDDGQLFAMIWHIAGDNQMYRSIPHVRTFEGVLNGVDKLMATIPKKATAADFGLNDDGTLIYPVPAFLVSQAAE